MTGPCREQRQGLLALIRSSERPRQPERPAGSAEALLIATSQFGFSLCPSCSPHSLPGAPAHAHPVNSLHGNLDRLSLLGTQPKTSRPYLYNCYLMKLKIEAAGTAKVSATSTTNNNSYSNNNESSSKGMIVNCYYFKFGGNLIPKSFSISVHYLPSGKGSYKERLTFKRKCFAILQNSFPTLQKTHTHRIKM